MRSEVRLSEEHSPFTIQWQSVPGGQRRAGRPYTSPGFETLWRCRENLITVEEARDKLVDLYRSDPTFKNHINSGGKSYVEVSVLRYMA